MFAWEWLRRTPAYQGAWRRAATAAERRREAAAFGLVELVSPALGADVARPIWRAAFDPHVLRAVPDDTEFRPGDALDIRTYAGLGLAVSVEDDVEHWRVGDAHHALRIDLDGGTLLGGPQNLCFPLAGLARLAPKLQALAALVALHGTRQLPALRPEARALRWIAELRVCDALAAGATQQEMGSVLLGPAVARDGWRKGGESHRLRIQRLVRAARARLKAPLDPRWFRDR